MEMQGQNRYWENGVLIPQPDYYDNNISIAIQSRPSSLPYHPEFPSQRTSSQPVIGVPQYYSNGSNTPSSDSNYQSVQGIQISPPNFNPASPGDSQISNEPHNYDYIAAYSPKTNYRTLPAGHHIPTHSIGNNTARGVRCYRPVIIVVLVFCLVIFGVGAPILYFTVFKPDKQVGNPPLDGNWNDWQPWSDCSATCGNGNMTRNRTCDNPRPSFGGNDCEGSALESQSCKLANCSVNGNWSVWLPWSSCSTTCDNGTRTRNRTCDNPVPAFGGDECDGFDTESEVCMIIHCPVNGGWNTWQPWSDCSTTCGGGLQNRTRTCDNPAPEHNGQDCDEHDFETSACGEVTCPPPCVLGTWTEWNDCSASCGEGVSRRTRICDNSNGCECIGTLSESKSCQLLKCYDSWGAWSACSVTCGSGIRTRTRTCDNKFTGQECGRHTPTFKNRKTCENSACLVSFCANRNASCQYTHPNRCDLYIECDENKAMHEHMCNVLLRYKVDTKDECTGVCDWEANVPCSA